MFLKGENTLNQCCLIMVENNMQSVFYYQCPHRSLYLHWKVIIPLPIQTGYGASGQKEPKSPPINERPAQKSLIKTKSIYRPHFHHKYPKQYLNLHFRIMGKAMQIISLCLLANCFHNHWHIVQLQSNIIEPFNLHCSEYIVGQWALRNDLEQVYV